MTVCGVDPRGEGGAIQRIRPLLHTLAYSCPGTDTRVRRSPASAVKAVHQAFLHVNTAVVVGLPDVRHLQRRKRTVRASAARGSRWEAWSWRGVHPRVALRTGDALPNSGDLRSDPSRRPPRSPSSPLAAYVSGHDASRRRHGGALVGRVSGIPPGHANRGVRGNARPRPPLHAVSSGFASPRHVLHAGPSRLLCVPETCSLTHGLRPHLRVMTCSSARPWARALGGVGRSRSSPRFGDAVRPVSWGRGPVTVKSQESE